LSYRGGPFRRVDSGAYNDEVGLLGGLDGHYRLLRVANQLGHHRRQTFTVSIATICRARAAPSRTRHKSSAALRRSSSVGDVSWLLDDATANRFRAAEPKIIVIEGNPAENRCTVSDGGKCVGKFEIAPGSGRPECAVR
jgi:hypothetical protein